MLFVLTHYVRCLSVAQVARLLTAAHDPARAATDLVRRFVARSLVETRTVMVHPPLHLRGPLYSCASPGPPPKFDALAYRVQSRWRGAAKRTVVVRATVQAARFTGGPLPARVAVRDTELAHDLTLAELFLDHYHGRGELLWTPEDVLLADGWPGHDALVPDAVIYSPQGDRALELAGRSYSARRLAAVDRAFRASGYELW